MEPIPQVDHEDVERIIRRDFPGEQMTDIMAILNQYGNRSWQGEPERERVQLAALKLAEGDIEALRREILTAKSDYRDVLAHAENPEYFRNLNAGKLSDDERERLFERDWSQYQAWLRRE
jgi:hypothetical protein